MPTGTSGSKFSLPRNNAHRAKPLTYGNICPGFKLGGLQRALNSVQEENFNQLVNQHCAFIRFRLHGTLLREAGATARDPKAELLWLLNLAASLSDLPEILLYYNPSAELLLLPEHLRSTLKANAAASLFPVESFTKTRFWRINDTWRLAETMGMVQLDMDDHEYAEPNNFIHERQLSDFLRGVCKHQLMSQAIYLTNDTASGPDGVVCIAELREKSVVEPDRKVIHWQPIPLQAGSSIPPELEWTE